ncbi:MAG: NAD(P)-dependent oxidoreductase [Alphaproteobacteria bacterium]|nr:NAD(P)-dependent oxidoreductase [Alphaproteobacteria bacterium]
MRVGFVGLGLMGLPMARNLLRAGHELVVYSASADARAAIVGDGAKLARSVRDIAADVEVFCACRVTPEQSREVFLGPDGVMASGASGLLCVDFATVDPATSRQIGTALAASGIGFIDAPISGGPPAAKAASLSIIAGGSDADMARVKPLFDVMGKHVYHMGPVGAGVSAKLCNNMITITTHALLAEALVFGVKSGIDPHKLYEALRGSSARSNTLERVFPNHFLPRDFTAAASITTISKDLGCAIEAAAALGVALRLPNAAMALYREAAAQGLSDRDIAAVLLPIEQAAGIAPAPSR